MCRGCNRPRHCRALRSQDMIGRRQQRALAAAALSLSGAHGGGKYTYKFEWDLYETPPPSKAVIPIDGMPATHPKVINPVCGEQLSAGDPIPALSYWSTSGSSTLTGSCSQVPSGQMFYGYNYPSTSSCNTGYVVPDALSQYT